MMPNEISEIARKWAYEAYNHEGIKLNKIAAIHIGKCIQSAIDEAMQQQTDPLPVMEEAAEWLEDIQSDGWDSKEIWSRLLDTIAQIRRERGLTEAAEHMRELKEADNEPK